VGQLRQVVFKLPRLLERFYGSGSPFQKFTTTVSNCEFRHNFAQDHQSVHDTMLGGGAAILNGASEALNPLGISLEAFYAQTTETNNLFVNNRAPQSNGASPCT